MKKIALFLGCILTLPVWAASDDATGAFGYKLRYFYEEAKETKDPLNKIVIKPESEYKFLMFNDYTLSVTPKTYKIYAINAIGKVFTSCQEDSLIIENFLKKKYEFSSTDRKIDEHVTVQKDDGNLEKDKNIATIYDLSKTRIYLTCNREKDIIAISYVDTEMAIQASLESQDMFDKNMADKIKALKDREDFNVKGL